MKVKDLITELEKVNSELLVVVDGYEWGYDDIDEISMIKLGRHVEDNCIAGEHDKDANGTEHLYIGSLRR